MEETRLGERVAGFAFLTANRFRLSRVGSGPRHDIAASGRDAMTSHPSGLRADAIVITSLPQDTTANYPVSGFPLIRIYAPIANT